MPTLAERAIDFLQSRFPSAPVASRTLQFTENGSGTVIKPGYICISYDPHSAVTQSLVAVPNLGAHDELDGLVATISTHLSELSSGYRIDTKTSSGPSVTSDRMVASPRLVVYTDELCCPPSVVFSEFERAGHLIELIHETELHHSVFISYGGPDEEFARALNNYLRSHSVKTWFFPEDALPGQKLHRVMSEGVTKHDRVLLICTSASLTRPGVQNELERVLEREAREGGSDILIPITLDRFVFDNWRPPRSDIADQVRARVVTAFPASPADDRAFETAGVKLLKALRR